MKNKTIADQIDASHRILEAIGEKGKAGHSTKTRGKIKFLSKSLKDVMALQSEVQKLKHQLKSKKKKLKASLKEFTISSKELKKSFHKDK